MTEATGLSNISKCDTNEVSDRLHCDEGDPGLQIMSDEDNVTKVQNTEPEDEDGELGDNEEDNSPYGRNSRKNVIWRLGRESYHSSKSNFEIFLKNQNRLSR